MSGAEAMAWLESLSQLGMRFGLERMQRALSALGHPERRLRVLHVAGTNGKGSTCAFAASLLREAGHKVGLYTSPHLVRMSERIQVDGREISDAETAAGVEAILAAFPAGRAPDDPLTFFEADTLLALWHFARVGVEIAVLETGLGGRLDATNAVASEVALVTRIGLDHTQLLGDTLAAIAEEKAGIFKPGARAIIARQPADALAVLLQAARRTGSPTLVAGRDFALEGDTPCRFRSGELSVDALSLPLLGAHQRENAETAIAAARRLAPGLGAEAIRRGLAATRWPGRLEIVERAPLTVLDGAHNPDAARALADAVRRLFPEKRIHLVFGMLADKDVAGVAALLVPLAQQLYLASPCNERALPVKSLEAVVAPHAVPARSFPTIAEALAAARSAVCVEGEGSLALLAGSLYAVGEAKVSLPKQPD